MAEKRAAFAELATEHERQRDILRGQSLSPRSPHEFIGVSVKEADGSGWRHEVRTGIRRTCAVIVLASTSSLPSEGHGGEDQHARDADKKIRGICAYSDRPNAAGRRSEGRLERYERLVVHRLTQRSA